MKIQGVIEKVITRVSFYASFLVLVIIGMVLIEAILRHALLMPVPISYEMSRYAMVALIALGLASCWRVGGHVRILSVVSILPVRVANWLRLITLTVALVFLILVDYGISSLLSRTLKLGKKSDTLLAIPLFWPQLIMGIGFLLLTVWLIVEIMRAVCRFRAGQPVEVEPDEY